MVQLTNSWLSTCTRCVCGCCLFSARICSIINSSNSTLHLSKWFIITDIWYLISGSINSSPVWLVSAFVLQINIILQCTILFEVIYTSIYEQKHFNINNNKWPPVIKLHLSDATPSAQHNQEALALAQCAKGRGRILMFPYVIVVHWVSKFKP